MVSQRIPIDFIVNSKCIRQDTSQTPQDACSGNGGALRFLFPGCNPVSCQFQVHLAIPRRHERINLVLQDVQVRCTDIFMDGKGLVPEIDGVTENPVSGFAIVLPQLAS